MYLTRTSYRKARAVLALLASINGGKCMDEFECTSSNLTIIGYTLGFELHINYSAVHLFPCETPHPKIFVVETSNEETGTTHESYLVHHDPRASVRD
jgi:hypothetical protein